MLITCVTVSTPDNASTSSCDVRSSSVKSVGTGRAPFPVTKLCSKLDNLSWSRKRSRKKSRLTGSSTEAEAEAEASWEEEEEGAATVDARKEEEEEEENETSR